jgi:CRISPR/Cas system CSM-associated protein Csm3 (group 7 of RAMP superfamily)
MKEHIIYYARLTVEAASPLRIGSGRQGLTVDQLVARDAYGLPYLPGTSIAGCLRSTLLPNPAIDADKLFGFQGKNAGQGSQLIISSGHLIGGDGQVVGESGGLPVWSDAFLTQLSSAYLPLRDHVRINHRGVAEKHGKFDSQVVPRGARFVFDLSLSGSPEEEALWGEVLDQFRQPFFRLGGGTRKGFGKLRVEEYKQRTFDLTDGSQRKAYLDLSSSLAGPLPGFSSTRPAPASAPEIGPWKLYELTLTARDYFSFGQGYGDDKVRNRPKREPIVKWENGRPKFYAADDAPYLLPATSIKGALRHRTAFHYNKETDVFIEDQRLTAPELKQDKIVEELLKGYLTEPGNNIKEVEAAILALELLLKEFPFDNLGKSETYAAYKEELEAVQSVESRPHLGEQNEAIRALFGYAVEREEEEEGEKESARRGRVLIEDVYLEPGVEEKAFSHVMIDRFTGGAKPGALFNESVARTNEIIQFKIYVHEDALQDEKIKAAFEAALNHLATGQLPLGGSVAKGHGIFSGSLKKNQEV